MPYMWQGALSMMSQSLLIMGATMSPSLRPILMNLVPDNEALDDIMDRIVAEVGLYADLAPSLKLAFEIIRDADLRRRAYLGT